MKNFFKIFFSSLKLLSFSFAISFLVVFVFCLFFLRDIGNLLLIIKISTLFSYALICTIILLPFFVLGFTFTKGVLDPYGFLFSLITTFVIIGMTLDYFISERSVDYFYKKISNLGLSKYNNFFNVICALVFLVIIIIPFFYKKITLGALG